jgi:hypothetical protein
MLTACGDPAPPAPPVTPSLDRYWTPPRVSISKSLGCLRWYVYVHKRQQHPEELRRLSPGGKFAIGYGWSELVGSQRAVTGQAVMAMRASGDTKLNWPAPTRVPRLPKGMRFHIDVSAYHENDY